MTFLNNKIKVVTIPQAAGSGTYNVSLNTPTTGSITVTDTASGNSFVLPPFAASLLQTVDTNTSITITEDTSPNSGDTLVFTVDGVEVGKVEKLSGGITKWTLDGILDPIVYAGTPQTIAQRDALTSPVAGWLMYIVDTGISAYQYYDGTAWQTVGAGGSATPGINAVLALSEVLTASRTINMATNTLTIGNGTTDGQTVFSGGNITSTDLIQGAQSKQLGILVAESQVDFTTAEPTLAAGNLYINTVTGTSSGTSFAATANRLYQVNASGTSFTEYTPIDGWVAYIKDQDSLFTFDGTSWTIISGSSANFVTQDLVSTSNRIHTLNNVLQIVGTGQKDILSADGAGRTAFFRVNQGTAELRVSNTTGANTSNSGLVIQNTNGTSSTVQLTSTDPVSGATGGITALGDELRVITPKIDAGTAILGQVPVLKNSNGSIEFESLKYSQTFVTGDWVSDNVSKSTISITGATHGKGNNPTVIVCEGSGASIDKVEVAWRYDSTNGNVTIEILEGEEFEGILFIL